MQVICPRICSKKSTGRLSDEQLAGERMHFHSWHNKMKYFFTRVESKLTMGFRRDTAIVAFLIGFSSKLSWILALDRVFILCQGWVGGFYSGQALMCALWCLDAN